MSVKTALALINQVLDEVLAENDGDTRQYKPILSQVVLDLWLGRGSLWRCGEHGDVGKRHREGPRRGWRIEVWRGKKGTAHPSGDLPFSWNPALDDRISVWEVTCHLARVLSDENGGLDSTAQLLAAVSERGDINLESVQLLAYRLYELTQDQRPEDARLFNALGGSWADLTTAADSVAPAVYVQETLDLGEDD